MNLWLASPFNSTKPNQPYHYNVNKAEIMLNVISVSSTSKAHRRVDTSPAWSFLSTFGSRQIPLCLIFINRIWIAAQRSLNRCFVVAWICVNWRRKYFSLVRYHWSIVGVTCERNFHRNQSLWHNSQFNYTNNMQTGAITLCSAFCLKSSLLSPSRGDYSCVSSLCKHSFVGFTQLDLINIRTKFSCAATRPVEYESRDSLQTGWGLEISESQLEFWTTQSNCAAFIKNSIVNLICSSWISSSLVINRILPAYQALKFPSKYFHYPSDSPDVDESIQLSDAFSR